MPTAKKLPSGSWNCRVLWYIDENGKKKWKSFTCSDPSAKGKRKCEAMAAEWAAEKEKKSRAQITMGEAAREYIDHRLNVLSPTTVTAYRSYVSATCEMLWKIPVDMVTADDLQKTVNELTLDHSPKTVRNIHGFITAVLGQYRPDFAVRTKLPQKDRPNLHIPSELEVQKLLEKVKGTEMELPILLAAFGPMRRSEICALKMEDIDGTVVHVRRAMVQAKSADGVRSWAIKTPKSYAGDRYIDYPAYVAKLWEGRKDKVTDLNPNQITMRFVRIVKGLGVPHFRFHDLRHYSASFQHSLGIPDQYIQQRGGWQTDATLKAVYRHSLPGQQKQISSQVNDAFSKLVETKVETT